MIVTFCGHNDVYDPEQIGAWLQVVVRQLINQGATHFYCGGYGGFDRIVSGVLKKEKEHTPHIQRILVLAYLRDNPYAQRKKKQIILYPGH